jgi:hypothetical protein
LRRRKKKLVEALVRFYRDVPIRNTTPDPEEMLANASNIGCEWTRPMETIVFALLLVGRVDVLQDLLDELDGEVGQGGHGERAER